MVRRFLGYLLITALVSANFSQLFIYTGFELNRNYIAAHLCINRSKPWLHCNGKCYFMRKIKQAEKKEKNDERQSQRNFVQQALSAQKTETCFYNQVMQDISAPRKRIALPVADLPIFQPPKLG